MRHRDAGEVQHGAEMEGETSLSRVISARGVDEENFRQPAQRSNRPFEQRPFPQGQQPGP